MGKADSLPGASLTSGSGEDLVPILIKKMRHFSIFFDPYSGSKKGDLAATHLGRQLGRDSLESRHTSADGDTRASKSPVAAQPSVRHRDTLADSRN